MEEPEVHIKIPGITGTVETDLGDPFSDVNDVELPDGIWHGLGIENVITKERFESILNRNKHIIEATRKERKYRKDALREMRQYQETAVESSARFRAKRDELKRKRRTWKKRISKCIYRVALELSEEVRADYLVRMRKKILGNTGFDTMPS